MMPRFKPFKYAFEKEIVMYARALRLDYFSTECKYAPYAYRGFVRAYIKDLEMIRPRSILGNETAYFVFPDVIESHSPNHRLISFKISLAPVSRWL